MNPFVFIVGCARSGTTLLQRVVNAHPQIAVTDESRWIVRCFDHGRGLSPEGLVGPEFVSQLLEEPKFAPAWRISREELQSLLEELQPVPYERFVAGIFNLYGRALGKALVGNKTPAFVRALDTLHRLWPQTRIVHLIRDGRDVAMSMMAWPKVQQRKVKPAILKTWEEDPISTIALWWEFSVRRGREEGASLGRAQYYEIRYESLVNDPVNEVSALCVFLGLPYDDVMLRYHEDRVRAKPSRDAKHAWLPITPGLRDWKAQMAVEDVERFEAAAGELLEQLGYSRAVRRHQPEKVRHASRLRDVFMQDRRAEAVSKYTT